MFDGQLLDADGLVYAGVDFDNVILGGEITSLAQERIKRLGSYTERSVSGSGLHVIVKAQPLASGIAHDGVEMYTSGRFFTMTGRAPQNARIIAAPEAFAALADELQAQVRQFSGYSDNSFVGQRRTSADANRVAWLGKLPSEQQSEVIRYAALHIAKHSKLFELTKHGGNYQEYLKLAFAIARSGVDEAEAIFVEAASTAKDAVVRRGAPNFFPELRIRHARPKRALRWGPSSTLPGNAAPPFQGGTLPRCCSLRVTNRRVGKPSIRWLRPMSEPSCWIAEDRWRFCACQTRTLWR